MRLGRRKRCPKCGKMPWRMWKSGGWNWVAHYCFADNHYTYTEMPLKEWNKRS